MPADLIQGPVPGPGRTGAARIFPLGLGRQPIAVAGGRPLDLPAVAADEAETGASPVNCVLTIYPRQLMVDT